MIQSLGKCLPETYADLTFAPVSCCGRFTQCHAATNTEQRAGGMSRGVRSVLPMCGPRCRPMTRSDMFTFPSVRRQVTIMVAGVQAMEYLATAWFVWMRRLANASGIFSWCITAYGIMIRQRLPFSPIFTAEITRYAPSHRSPSKVLSTYLIE